MARIIREILTAAKSGCVIDTEEEADAILALFPTVNPAQDPIREPGMGWKLSDAARDKIMQMASDNVHNAAALQSIVLASLSAPLPKPSAEGE